jgi:FMN phosphatase YigB (HAD superfamily)
MEQLGVGMQDILFVGDRLDPQGNDHPVQAMGIRSVPVKSWQDTADFIEGWL